MLDFAVETRNLGLIIIRLSRKQGIFYLQMLVESEDKGKTLQEALEEIQQFLSIVINEAKLNIRIKPWELLNPVEKKEIVGELFRVSYVLDERV